MLVDGPFVEEQKSLQLAFRGSANQRILRKKTEYLPKQINTKKTGYDWIYGRIRFVIFRAIPHNDCSTDASSNFRQMKQKAE
ncbi:MAG: hypothetical protein ACLSFT_01250 [Ruminococcus callidus]